MAESSVLRPGSKMCFILLLLTVIQALWAGAPSAQAPLVFVIDLEGPINPGSAMYVERGLEAAGEAGAAMAVIRIDTPGGLASSMRTIIKAIVNSRVPVATFVGPRGAGAASAGVMVTVAGHLAAMAPGTNIGAAHPVSAGGGEIDETMSEKVVNDMVAYARGIAESNGRNGEWVEKAIRESVSITAEEALERNVVDMLTGNVEQLVAAADGRTVKMGGKEFVLQTAGARLKPFEPGWRDRLLKTISDPNIAYLLMMIGLAGLYFELAHPGAIFPGVIGGISLILAFFAFQTLPVNYAGLLLVALAIVLFIIEVKVTSYGLLSIAGLVALTLGSVMLFEDVKVSLRFMTPTIALVGGFFVVVAGLAFRAYRRKPMGGEEGLVGEVGVVQKTIDPEGLVFVHGEYWNAEAAVPIEVGAKVEVEKVEGLKLRVKRLVD